MNLKSFLEGQYRYYLFDLDNTLYDENIYLFSAYFKIANYLEKKYPNNSKLDYYHFLIDEFIHNGRTNLFQKLLANYQINYGEINNLLKLLRTLKISPKIELNNETHEILGKLLNLNKKIAIITNGNIQQQKNKIAQINWKNILDYLVVIYAEEYEPKPGIKSFLKITKEFRDSNPERYVMIGDSKADKQFALNCNIRFISIGELKLI